MTLPLTFHFTEALVRVIERKGDPWFVAADITAILGYRDAANMVRNLDDDEVGTHIMSTLGGDQTMTIISESGLYHAIFVSRRKEAQAFRKWVTGEVLPTLRKTGRMDLLEAAQNVSVVQFDSARLSASVAAVREARRTYGHAAARRMWHSVGLPDVATDLRTDNDFIDALQKYLAQVASTTITEAADALGIELSSMSDHLRIGQSLRECGWFPRKVKRGRRTVNLFTLGGTHHASV